ncbi:hypothetical protein MTP04_02140 [Lysinibacillus sp. PLM2]|nr:hypothetical protein MTP04_02140 [Lysinibacillus sp. PLM2]
MSTKPRLEDKTLLRSQSNVYETVSRGQNVVAEPEKCLRNHISRTKLDFGAVEMSLNPCLEDKTKLQNIQNVFDRIPLQNRNLNKYLFVIDPAIIALHI